MIWLLIAWGEPKRCDSCGALMVIRLGRFVCLSCGWSS